MKDLESLQTAEQSLMDLQERWVSKTNCKSCEDVLWACAYTLIFRLVHTSEMYVHFISHIYKSTIVLLQ